MGSKFFKKAVERTGKDSKIFAAKSLDIVEQIHTILEKQGKTQKDLAQALGKSESEVSKWLSSLHNLTLRSIAKLEAVLGEEILIAPMFWNEYKGMFSQQGDKANQVENETSTIPVKALHPKTALYAKPKLSYKANVLDIVPETIAEKPLSLTPGREPFRQAN